MTAPEMAAGRQPDNLFRGEPFRRGLPKLPARDVDPLLRNDYVWKLATEQNAEVFEPDPHTGGHPKENAPQLSLQRGKPTQPSRSGTLMSRPFQFTEVYAWNTALGTIEKAWNQTPLMHPSSYHLPPRRKWISAFQVPCTSAAGIPRFHATYETDADGRIKGGRAAQLPVVVNDVPCFYYFVVSRLPLDKHHLRMLAAAVPDAAPLVDLGSDGVFVTLEGGTESLLPVCDALSILWNLHLEYELCCLRLGLFYAGDGTEQDKNRIKHRAQAYALGTLLRALRKHIPRIQNGLRQSNMLGVEDFLKEHDRVPASLVRERERLAKMLVAYLDSPFLATVESWYRERGGVPKPEWDDLERVRLHAVTRLAESDHGLRWIDRQIEKNAPVWQLIMPSARDQAFDKRIVDVINKSSSTVFAAGYEFLPRYLWNKRSEILRLARFDAVRASTMARQVLAATSDSLSTCLKMKGFGTLLRESERALGGSPFQLAQQVIDDANQRMIEDLEAQARARTSVAAAREQRRRAFEARSALGSNEAAAKMRGAWLKAQGGAKAVLLLLNGVMVVFNIDQLASKTEPLKDTDWMSLLSSVNTTVQAGVDLAKIGKDLQKSASQSAFLDRVALGTRLASPLLTIISTRKSMDRSRELDLGLKLTAERAILLASGGQVLTTTLGVFGVKTAAIGLASTVLGAILVAGIVIVCIADEDDFQSFARHCYFGKDLGQGDKKAPNWVVDNSWPRLAAPSDGLEAQLQTIIGLLMRFKVQGAGHDTINISLGVLLPDTLLTADCVVTYPDGKTDTLGLVIDASGAVVDLKGELQERVRVRPKRTNGQLSQVSIQIADLPSPSLLRRHRIDRCTWRVSLRIQPPGVMKPLEVPWEPEQRQYVLDAPDFVNSELRDCFADQQRRR